MLWVDARMITTYMVNSKIIRNYRAFMQKIGITMSRIRIIS